ncbi:serine/threonine-protein kinase [Candidatus Mycoplasma pogonae]
MLLPHFKTLNENYHVLRKIGEGGMSRVYLATSKKNHLRYAVKIMHSPKNRLENNKKRFWDEIKILQNLNSPYITEMHDYCFDERNEEFYLVLEYVEGEILKDVIERNGGLTNDMALNYIQQIAQGLKTLHEQNIIHRDIKSSNIMVNNANQVKIIDFGIATYRYTENIIKNNKIVGSAHYLPPEILKTNILIRESFDIYSFGILMYEMLIGETPFYSDESQLPQEILNKQVQEKILSLSKLKNTIPQALSQIVAKATHKDWKQRYQSLDELIQDVENFIKQEQHGNNKHKEGKNFWNWKHFSLKTILIWLSLVAIFLLILVVVLGVLFWGNN